VRYLLCFASANREHQPMRFVNAPTLTRRGIAFSSLLDFLQSGAAPRAFATLIGERVTLKHVAVTRGGQFSIPIGYDARSLRRLAGNPPLGYARV